MTREKGWHHPTVSWLSKPVNVFTQNVSPIVGPGAVYAGTLEAGARAGAGAGARAGGGARSEARICYLNVLQVTQNVFAAVGGDEMFGGIGDWEWSRK
eukprot:3907659-Prymnesium_polylepis.1